MNEQLLTKSFDYNHLKDIMRNILGIFFLLVAVIGALGMVTEILDWDLIEDTYLQFNSRAGSVTYKGGYSTSLAPIYYSACLFVGTWLLYGKKDN
ncbi:MAG TPA: hypothetical protein QGI69_02080 [Candidatus Marinimicrobia bacterium]|jgi:hypothetical protein|nr:hypothetical protein [Candidatus Neomarinimicrobiota bacterium]MDP7465744.1 hypothetical protein [Candidatus Neomarinimicrobiota bacterium]MDP7526180.1 hypothetical protein [Candidatus Neomarinimicrobiota bacterium]HJM84043.1 hypothetical protein [Candidatus Neomarinimicrobiota bacterium]|tara:strand:- start:98 stop:382 length:285 start_codon:yes stop_codon:yes gene_type:complete